jgi:chromatin segregation and condensation protein Rec8/ScpA/Scc1 (kleisin family)
LLAVNDFVYFGALFRGRGKGRMYKSEVIATFLALLELIKTKKVKAIQENAFDDIKILNYDEEPSVTTKEVLV